MSETGLCLPECIRALCGEPEDTVCEVRLRVNRAVETRHTDGSSRLSAGVVDQATFDQAVDELAGHSLYAWEEELRQGFFTLPDGSRVGAAGRFVTRDGRIERLSHIASVCVRVCRQIFGIAAPLQQALVREGQPQGALILSPPGLGKTTLLRDIARSFSLGKEGWPPCPVGVADERCELAACRMGVPTLDLGPRCDVYDACPKAQAIPLLLRAMGSRVIVTDEAGGPEDASAILEAARCGAAVMASAHAASLEDARRRPSLAPLFEGGVFARAIVLGGIGQIRSITCL